jgi:hypothetical protein
MDELFDKRKLMDFWPQKSQDPKERALATARFVIYTSVVLFVLKRDTRILMLGAGILFVLFMMYKNNMIKDAIIKVSMPDGGPSATANNFMGNPLMQNYPMGRDVSIPSNSNQVWESIHPFMEDKKFSQSNFFKMPNNNLADFLHGAYPSMFGPSCRDDTSVCDPDARPAWINSKGPARTNNGMY